MMKRMLALLLACLLPVTALAVTEGVVEAAPEVEIVLPETGNALFGMWEQGLDDIERAARQVLEERLHCPKDMKLVSIEVDEQVFGEQLYTKKWGNEEISSYLYVIFLFEDERMGGTMSGQVGFDFETGKLGQCSLGRWYDDDDDPDAHILDTQGYSGLNAEEERAILDNYLGNVLGFEDYEITTGQNATLADGSRLLATIGSKSHQVIHLSYSRFGGEGVIE